MQAFTGLSEVLFSTSGNAGIIEFKRGKVSKWIKLNVK